MEFRRTAQMRSRMTFAAMATQGRDIRFDLGRIGGTKTSVIKFERY